MTLEELFKDKQFLTSTNVEIALMQFIEDCGVSKNDVLAGRYDKQIGDAKERIYEQFNKLLS